MNGACQAVRLHVVSRFMPGLGWPTPMSSEPLMTTPRGSETAPWWWGDKQPAATDPLSAAVRPWGGRYL
jgi:hypothetical protein